MSQKDAAIMAVKAVGLNQLRPLGDGLPEMFYRRLDVLKQAEMR